MPYAHRVRDLLNRVVNGPRSLVLAILAVWVACSWTYAVLEDVGPIEGLWWGIVTGSTVGYGDFYPSTVAGRGVGAVLIVSMLVLVPIAIGHVIARFVHDRDEFTHEEQQQVLQLQREALEVARETNALVRVLLAETRGADRLHEVLASHAATDPATDPAPEDRSPA